MCDKIFPPETTKCVSPMCVEVGSWGLMLRETNFRGPFLEGWLETKG
jgi:hypothetical protein